MDILILTLILMLDYFFGRFSSVFDQVQLFPFFYFKLTIIYVFKPKRKYTTLLQQVFLFEGSQTGVQCKCTCNDGTVGPINYH